MTAKGFMAMLVLSLILLVGGVTLAFADKDGVQLVGGALLAVGAFALVGSAKVRGKHVRELQRRRDAGELV